MNVEIIKDFFVFFGFGIDEVGYEKFEFVFVGVIVNVIKIGLVVEGVVLFVVVFMVKIVFGLDNFYWVF